MIDDSPVRTKKGKEKNSPATKHLNIFFNSEKMTIEIITRNLLENLSADFTRGKNGKLENC